VQRLAAMSEAFKFLGILMHTASSFKGND